MARECPHQVPSVLVVIPCLDEVTTIEDVVTTALHEVSDTGGRVVVADGGSTDGTTAVLRAMVAKDPQLVVIHNRDRLQSAGINEAVRRHGHPHAYLMRVDAHGAYPPGYLATLVAEAERVDADAVVVSMRTLGAEGTFQAAVAAAQGSTMGNGGAAHRDGGTTGWVKHGHHALIRMESFRAVGGYDATFSHNEDAELDVRLCRAGYKIWLTSQVQFEYQPRSSVAALARQYFNFGRGRARTSLMHRTMERRQVAVALVLPAVVIAGPVPGSTLARLPVLAWVAGCAAAGHRASNASGRLDGVAIAAAYVVMHSAWSTGFWLTMVEQAAGKTASALRGASL